MKKSLKQQQKRKTLLGIASKFVQEMREMNLN